MVRHLLEYFHGHKYLGAAKHSKRKAWKVPARQERSKGAVRRQDPRQTSPATDNLKFLCDLGDNLPNHCDVGGNDLRFRMQVFRLPDAMVKDIFDFFGDVGTEVVDAVQNKPWPFWHVHDLVRLHTRVKGTKDGSSTSVRSDGLKNPVMTFAEGPSRLCGPLSTTLRPPTLSWKRGTGSHVYVLKKHETVLRVRCTATRKTILSSNFAPSRASRETWMPWKPATVAR